MFSRAGKLLPGHPLSLLHSSRSYENRETGFACSSLTLNVMGQCCSMKCFVFTLNITEIQFVA